MTCNVAVLGAGPAGIRAAIAARRNGLRVIIVDENQQPGGQIYRAPLLPPSREALRASAELRHGQRLRSALAASGATLLSRHRVWNVTPDRHVSCFGPDGPAEIKADALILAVGTTERVMPIPGVTTPGVIGLAAATILLKAHAALPPGPVVIAGVGPLLYAVAAGILKAGGTVAAVVDLLRPAEWSAAVPRLLGRPDLLARGAGWMTKLARRGVPIHRGATITKVVGDDTVEGVEIARVGPDWTPGPRRTVITAGSLAIGHGLTPATEMSRLLRLPHRFSADRGGWVPDVAADRSAGERLYLAGDCAGVSGAAAAEWAGELAGLSAARDLGVLDDQDYADETQRIRPRLTRAERFGCTIGRMMAWRPGLTASATSDTIVCRCEDVVRETIDRVAARGARHVNQLKSTTRCGMGPCQGRSCADAAAEILARQTGQDRSQVGVWTARTPLRPMPLATALGEYSYADIPCPPMLPA